MEFCVLCEERPGQYNYHSGGLVCELCMSSNDTCPDCGEVLNVVLHMELIAETAK